MSESKKRQRSQLGIVARCNEISYYLSKRYATFPGKTKMDFITDACPRIQAMDDGTTDEPRALLDLLLKSDDPDVPLAELPSDPMFPLVLSAAFLLRAMTAARDGQDERGWNYLADAAYWCGLAQAGRHAALVQAEAVSNANKAKSKKAVNQRHEPERQTMEFAWQRVRELCPEGGWKPRVDAARKIQKEVADFAQARGWIMVQGRQIELIDKWLSDMPDAHRLFPSQRRKPKST